MITINAKVILASIASGVPLTTMEVVFPKFLLSEFNTHRMFSRNSASSRAIPFKKNLESVLQDPFIPLRFQRHHTGMQGAEYLEGEEHNEAVAAWLTARDSACREALDLFERGITKQICNRILEPFMWHTVIVTATDFGNFFALRDHPDAEIHMQALAREMLNAYINAPRQEFDYGGWHIPYGEQSEGAAVLNDVEQHNERAMIEKALHRSVVNCARVSYLKHQEMLSDEEVDERFNKLAAAGHMSPFEHQARVSLQINNKASNFRAPWYQYRKMLTNECRTYSAGNDVIF